MNETSTDVNGAEPAPGQTPPDLPPLESQPLAARIARLGWDKLAIEPCALRVQELVHYTDFFVVMSGRSDRHVAAIWQSIDDTLRAEDGRRPLSLEGTERNQWVVMDYGDVVAHVFFEPVRAFYELEKLWAEAPLLPLDLPEAQGPVSEP